MAFCLRILELLWLRFWGLGLGAWVAGSYRPNAPCEISATEKAVMIMVEPRNINQNPNIFSSPYYGFEP